MIIGRRIYKIYLSLHMERKAYLKKSTMRRLLKLANHYFSFFRLVERPRLFHKSCMIISLDHFKSSLKMKTYERVAKLDKYLGVNSVLNLYFSSKSLHETTTKMTQCCIITRQTR